MIEKLWNASTLWIVLNVTPWKIRRKYAILASFKLYWGRTQTKPLKIRIFQQLLVVLTPLFWFSRFLSFDEIREISVNLILPLLLLSLWPDKLKKYTHLNAGSNCLLPIILQNKNFIIRNFNKNFFQSSVHLLNLSLR